MSVESSGNIDDAYFPSCIKEFMSIMWGKLSSSLKVSARINKSSQEFHNKVKCNHIFFNVDLLKYIKIFLNLITS